MVMNPIVIITNASAHANSALFFSGIMVAPSNWDYAEYFFLSCFCIRRSGFYHDISQANYHLYRIYMMDGRNITCF
jgi:hypothetical protein